MNNVQRLWDNSQRLTSLEFRRERRKTIELKKMFEEVIVIKMSNLAEDINLQIQKYEET